MGCGPTTKQHVPSMYLPPKPHGTIPQTPWVHLPNPMDPSPHHIGPPCTLKGYVGRRERKAKRKKDKDDEEYHNSIGLGPQASFLLFQVFGVMGVIDLYRWYMSGTMAMLMGAVIALRSLMGSDGMA